MTLILTSFLFLIHFSQSLIIKDFETVKIDPNSIKNFTELEKSQGMDYFQCAYFCLKQDDCQAFYITDKGSCRQVPIDQEFFKGNHALFTNQTIKFSKV